MGSIHRFRTLVPAVVFLAVTLALIPSAARAQSLWAPRVEGGAVQVEIFRPTFDADVDLSLATSLWFLTARIPLSEKALLELDLPFSHLGIDDGASYSTIGNPHLGIELRDVESGASLQFSARLPLVDETEAPAILMGTVSDISRWEAWAVDIFPVGLLGRFERTDDRGFGVRIDAGPTIWFATGDRQDTEFLAIYAFQGLYANEDVQVGLGLHGRAILSDDDFDVGESTLHEIGASFALRAGRAWPGLQVRLPIDDNLGEVVDYTLGLQVTVPIGGASS